MGLLLSDAELLVMPLKELHLYFGLQTSWVIFYFRVFVGGALYDILGDPVSRMFVWGHLS